MMSFPNATVQDVERAAQAAASSFRAFATSPSQKRGALLRRIADNIEALGDKLVDCVHRETALPTARILSERGRTCMQLRLFADEAENGAWTKDIVDPADPTRQPPRPLIRLRNRPIGPVAVFSASNFPLAFSVAGGDTAAAFAAGCSVIVKAHPGHPETSALVAKAVSDAVQSCELPAGVFSILFESGYEVGLSLVEHPLIKAGAFTGSLKGGLALWRIAQSRPEPIPFFAEMGSVNPVFVFPGAANQSLAEGLAGSLTLGVGQFCTQPGLIFVVDDADGRVFLKQLAEAVARAAPGRMLTQAMQMHYTDILRHRASKAGVAKLAQVSASSTEAGAALFSVNADMFLSAPDLAEEVFGPTSLAVLCKSAKDFERCATALPGQLTATIWSDKPEERTDLVWGLEQKAGRIVFNGFPTGVEVGAAMVHGGPFPATTDSRFTSVGTQSIYRFLRPVAYQNE